MVSPSTNSPTFGTMFFYFVPSQPNPAQHHTPQNSNSWKSCNLLSNDDQLELFLPSTLEAITGSRAENPFITAANEGSTEPENPGQSSQAKQGKTNTSNYRQRDREHPFLSLSAGANQTKPENNLKSQISSDKHFFPWDRKKGAIVWLNLILGDYYPLTTQRFTQVN